MNKQKEWSKKEDTLTDTRKANVGKVLESMKEAQENGVEYQRGWFVSNEFPKNARTDKNYQGMNVMVCLASRFEDPRFLTGADINTLFKESDGKIKIRKGEKATRISYTSEYKKSETNLDGDEEEISKRFTKYYNVFNISQLDGKEELDKLFPRTPRYVMSEIEENQFISDVAEAMKKDGLRIEHRASGSAHYIPSQDMIEMPEPHRFRTSSDYYRTLLHELGHAMGHKSRCDRSQTAQFGSKDYAYEELVAELTSQFMGMETGVKYDSRTIDNHASYLNSWIDVISKDPEDKEKFLSSAASKAYKGYDMAMVKLGAYRLENLAEIKLEQAEEVIPRHAGNGATSQMKKNFFRLSIQ